MHQLNEETMIWNRACDEDALQTLPGDRALRDMLRVHGLVMNGGVLHAVECLATDQLSDGANGYRFYGFEEVASLLSGARQLFETGNDLELHEKQLNDQYEVLIPSDSSIVERFEVHLHSNPTDYARP